MNKRPSWDTNEEHRKAVLLSEIERTVRECTAVALIATVLAILAYWRWPIYVLSAGICLLCIYRGFNECRVFYRLYRDIDKPSPVSSPSQPCDICGAKPGEPCDGGLHG